jgi:phage terminase small subunit
MTRGRKALPDEIKALKGNPGKRRLYLSSEQGEEAGGLTAPDFVSRQLEKLIFARAAELLSAARFVRRTDTFSLGRWAVYMAQWVEIKRRLNRRSSKNIAETEIKADVYYETKSRHGTMLRVHPLWASLYKIEQVLMSHEDRLGLNPSARQAIVRGLINAPQLPAADLFADGAEKPAAPEKPQEPAGDSLGPLGFLTRPH